MLTYIEIRGIEGVRTSVNTHFMHIKYCKHFVALQEIGQIYWPYLLLDAASFRYGPHVYIPGYFITPGHHSLYNIHLIQYWEFK